MPIAERPAGDVPIRRLNIVGAGIACPGHLTLEALQAIRSCSKMAHLGVSPEHLAPLCEITGNVPAISLDELYEDGAQDQQNYSRIVTAVIGNLLSTDSLAFVLYGHPRMGVSLVRQLERTLGSEPVSISVLPGISSFDTIINDLAVDPLEYGSVIIDANRLLLFEIQLNPLLEHYIYHISSIGTALTNFTEPTSVNRLDLLREYLLRYFPPHHPAMLISSATAPDSHAERTELQLENLMDFASSIHYGHSLYIPHTKHVRLNEEFLRFLRQHSPSQ
jgi:uncharacterized protein YabN with tetrapyrrole methylase and pyrophosphatase domain